MASVQIAARTKAIWSRFAAGTPAIQLSYLGLSLSSAMARARGRLELAPRHRRHLHVSEVVPGLRRGVRDRDREQGEGRGCDDLHRSSLCGEIRAAAGPSLLAATLLL